MAAETVPYGRKTQRPSVTPEVHVVWMTAGLGCDGDSVSITAATQPSVEDVLLGAIPGLPKVHLHNPVLAYETGDDFISYWYQAEKGKLDPFVLVVEGSIPNEKIKKEGYWAAFGTDPQSGQPITTNEWIDRLAPKALAVIGCGTCATYGGIHAMEGNPTGCMGLNDYLGWDWRSKAGIPVVNVPGCPVQPDNFMETILYLLYQVSGLAPMIPLDDAGRPTWLFGKTVHEGCDRAGYYEQGDFATEYGSPKCIVKLGCWGPVVNCNVPKRGWMAGIGGCPNVGGICIGCTMPGFPDKFMPFMDEPPGGKISSAASGIYGRAITALRSITQSTLNKEPAIIHDRIERRNRMSTITAPTSEAPTKQRKLVEMNWDPITRIVGSLGIFTKIDFENREVAECHSTSSIFRGYSIFMKGKDPRDAHFITSRICGICGDNHATCATYAQNMAFGVRPPPLAEWIVNLGEAAEYMFDHNIFQDNLVGVDFCEQMVKETNPGVYAKAEQTASPHSNLHGYRTIADIMKALNPFSGSFYLEALQMSRLTREMFCLMEGRHVHPSTLYPGGVGTVPTVQLFTDYIVRLMKYVEFMKKVVPLHDDLFDFFYDALPGYEKVGQRRILLGCWGSFNNPDVCDYTYEKMTDWGRGMYVTPGVVVDGELVTTDLVDINLNIRILLGSSYYDDWQQGETFVQKDPLGNPVDKRHPWNQTTIPRPQKRDFGGKYTWVMSPRWYDKRTGDYLALDTGGGPIARFWATALAGLVDIGYVKATGKSVKIYLPKTASLPEVEFEWKIPKWSNAIERDRARTYFQAYAAACALHFAEKALGELHRGNTRTWSDFKVPDEAIGCGFHEAVRGVLSHHVVIRNGKIANYHPYPPTPWNANPRDIYGTPGPYEDAVQNTPIFEENGPDKFKGIDIMRTVRSFDPCLPCGVHMYLGDGKVLETQHSPMFGLQGQ
jgi:hydrogenase large subunit